jgi:hypothetical protein
MFAQMPQLAAAVRTGCVLRRNLPRLARQVRRQQPPRRFRAARPFGRDGRFRRRRRSLLSTARLQLVQAQFELFDLPRQFLGPAPELHPPQLGDQQLQMLDLCLARGQLLALPKNLLLLRGESFVLGEDEGSGSLLGWSTQQGQAPPHSRCAGTTAGSVGSVPQRASATRAHHIADAGAGRRQSLAPREAYNMVPGRDRQIR